MARGTLHAGKPAEQRRRRNAPTHAERSVTDDGLQRGPELPDGFDPAVVAWFETWRTSPQAQLFEATDWARLLMLAPIVQAYMRRPSAAALSEIRMNEERLGATVVDRMRARIVIERNEAAPALAPVTDVREALQRRLNGGN